MVSPSFGTVAKNACQSTWIEITANHMEGAKYDLVKNFGHTAGCL